MNPIGDPGPQLLASAPEGNTKGQFDGCTMARTTTLTLKCQRRPSTGCARHSLGSGVYAAAGKAKKTRGSMARWHDRVIVQGRGLAFMLRGHSGRLEGALTTPKDAF